MKIIADFVFKHHSLYNCNIFVLTGLIKWIFSTVDTDGLVHQ